MRRHFPTSRPAVVALSLAVAVVVAAGVTADAATSTPPMKLCANNITKAVSVPKQGLCAKGYTSFSVATDTQMSELGAQLDAQASLASDQAQKIADLTALVAEQGRAIEQQGELLSAHDRAIKQVEGAVATITYQWNQLSPVTRSITAVQGKFLMSGSSVFVIRRTGSGQSSTLLGTAEPDGTFVYLGPLTQGCADGVISFEGEAPDGSGVTSAALAAPTGC